MQINELLETHPLFLTLSEEDRRQVSEIARRRTFGAGETVFQKGGPGDAMYGVLTGTVSIRIASDDGEIRVVNHITDGEIFGEIALIDGLDRTADAVSERESSLLVIRRPDFWRLVDRQPKILIPLLNFLCARLRWLNTQTEESAFLNPEQRLARKLAHLSEAHGAKRNGLRKKEIGISQSELSELVGVSRESINRILQNWKKKELVELGRGKIRIKDWAAFEAHH